MLTIVTSFVLFYYYAYFCVLSVEGATGRCAGEDEETGAQWVHCGIFKKDSSDSDDDIRESCIIPSSINEGYISYGRDTHFILIPFSNSGGTDLEILCNDAFGDVNPQLEGKPKNDEIQHCCYTNINDMNNQFGSLTFLASNSFNYETNKDFINQQVIEAYQVTTNTISIANIQYDLLPANNLTANDKLIKGQALISSNKQFAAIITSDGELAIHRIADNQKLWTAPGSSNSGDNNYLIYQTDGDLILKHADGSNIWSIPSSAINSNTGLVKLYDDANLAIRTAANVHLWGSLNSGYTWSNAPTIVRYGGNGQYTYRIYTNSVVQCHFDVGFGDIIIPETARKCSYIFDNEALNNPSTDIGHYMDWVPCGTRYQDCAGLTNNIPQWVRFGGGDDGKWEYNLIVTGDNKIFCHESVFNFWDFEGLTHFVEGKRCERAQEPQYEFHNIIGYWSEVGSCTGSNCDTLQHTLTYGVTLKEEHELTQQWGISLTRSASMDYKMFGVTQQLTLSYSVAHRTLTSEVFTTLKTLTVKCGSSDQNFMYQWVTTAKEFIATRTQDITIKSKHYLCTSSSTTPNCAPGQCE